MATIDPAKLTGIGKGTPGPGRPKKVRVVTVTEGAGESMSNQGHGGGKVYRAVKWSINQASMEFSIERVALSKRLKALGLDPDDDGRFSTMQICAAKFGDYDMERARKVKEDADGSALDNARARKELGEKRLFLLFLAEVGTAVKQHITASSMTPEEQKDLCDELAILFNARQVTARICPD